MVMMLNHFQNNLIQCRVNLVHELEIGNCHLVLQTSDFGDHFDPIGCFKISFGHYVIIQREANTYVALRLSIIRSCISTGAMAGFFCSD